MTPPNFHLEGVRNFRDFGGVRTASGRVIAVGRLYRGGALHLMTESDRAALEGLGITTLLDLRSDAERQDLPCEWPAGSIVAAPLAHDRIVTDILEGFRAGTLTSSEIEDWWSLTGLFQAPEEHVASIRIAFDTLIQARPPTAVLIHCRGGKDRTGMVAAFVLEALGAHREDVLADFVRTNHSGGNGPSEREMATFANGLRRLSPGAVAAMQGVKAEWLETLLRRVRDRYGSVADYLAKDVGIGAEGLEALRANYLEPV